MREREFYSYEISHGRHKHIWAVAMPQMSAHLHIGHLPEEEGFLAKPTGGFEWHWREKPDWSDSEKPEHEQCWLNEGPCWHDGTSLWVSEYWIPRYFRFPDRLGVQDHREIFEAIKWEIKKRVKEEEDRCEEAER